MSMVDPIARRLRYACKDRSFCVAFASRTRERISFPPRNGAAQRCYRKICRKRFVAGRVSAAPVGLFDVDDHRRGSARLWIGDFGNSLPGQSSDNVCSIRRNPTLGAQAVSAAGSWSMMDGNTATGIGRRLFERA
ncbi:expressed unknown protein [Seminavis robusta]|uniref:Uncharacterized protein n=1 Tax=Seminavis robusta TaxID=568900 RepID=A0A9N8HT58_9STRA|nr:expressed unknown protein [Seminavis robusta]|eukprot:Sro1238_g255181.1  (135) ;mRNA; f:4407-4811